MAKKPKVKTKEKAPKLKKEKAPKEKKEVTKVTPKELEAKRAKIKEMKFLPDTAVLCKKQPQKETLCDFIIENEDGDKVFRREHIDLLDKETRKALDI